MNYNIFNQLHLTWKMILYNIKIIFANRFIYFLLAAIAIFLFIVIMNLAQGGRFNDVDAYEVLTLAGALIIFYPLTFGIQSDKDARTLEIIFGIPDYRYRVWLMRMLMIYLIAFLIILLLGWLINFALAPIKMWEVAFHVMFPLLFLGLLSFFLSTVVKSGNATAAVVIILGLVLLIASDEISKKFWNVFFNPYHIGSKTSQAVWAKLVFRNRLFLAVGSIIFMLSGLMSLQQREKFLG